MARAVVVCPSCSNKLETDARNIGREGLCPDCEEVFTIPDTAPPVSRISGGGRFGRLPAEYGDFWAISGVVLVAVTLLALLGSTMMDWIDPTSPAAEYVAWHQRIVLAVTVACTSGLIFSALTRKSFAPVVLLSCLWGSAAFVFLTGMLRRMETIAATPTVDSRIARTFYATTGLYVGSVAAVLLVAASFYTWYQCRSTGSVRWYGLFMVIAFVVGVFLGLHVVRNEVHPALDDLSGVVWTSRQPLEHSRTSGGPAAHRPAQPMSKNSRALACMMRRATRSAVARSHTARSSIPSSTFAMPSRACRA